MPRILIDNTPPSYVFQDGNQLTDGIANFGRALIQAPLAAAQIRQDQQQQEMANTWRQAEIDRQNRQDALNELWHNQGQQRQAEQDAIARAGMGLPVEGRTDLQPLVDEANQTRNFNQNYRQAMTNEANARAFWMSPIGKAIGGLFGQDHGGVRGGSDRPTAATLKAAHELADAEAQRRGAVSYDELGKRVVSDPSAWNTILKEAYKLHGISVPAGWQDVPDKGAKVPTNDVSLQSQAPKPVSDNANFLTKGLQLANHLTPIEAPKKPMFWSHPISTVAQGIGNLFYGGDAGGEKAGIAAVTTRDQRRAQMIDRLDQLANHPENNTPEAQAKINTFRKMVVDNTVSDEALQKYVGF